MATSDWEVILPPPFESRSRTTHRQDCYEASAVSRDGSHWFMSTQPVELEPNLGMGPRQLYVITPEAVATKE